jgi:hypothetical protein
VLTGTGVTAWRRALGRQAPAAAPDTPGTARGALTARTPVPLPGPVTAELVHVLAGLAVAPAGT